MKEKIIMLILGIIIGVVLAGVCFWFATTINRQNDGNMPEMNRGEMRQDPGKNNGENTTSTENTLEQS